MLQESARRSLAVLLGPRQMVVDPTELITYEGDAGLDRGRPDGVVFPRGAEEAAAIVRWAAAHGVPLIARGAGTGLAGGVVAEQGGLIVEFARMEAIRELDERGRSAVVEPGVVNLRLDERAKAAGLYFPADPASQRSSTIGGNVASNAGGPHCFKYGVTTNYVTGLEVALADGRLVRLGGRAFDYPEYDLCGLLTGSEGTLGLIVKVYVRLVRNPPAVKTLMAIFDSVEQAGTAVSALIATGLVPATMEMMDQKITRIIEDYVHAGLPTDAGAVLIVEVDGYPAGLDPQIAEAAAILEAHGGRGLRSAQSAEEREKIWYARKSAAGAMSRLAPSYYLVDGTVPRSFLADTLAKINRILEELGLRAGYVFHAGDGNLHPLILIDDPGDQALMKRVLAAGEQIMALCVSRDGSITGEHGVGIEKRGYMALMYSADELAAMRDVKLAFDPDDRFNPGKVLPADGPEGAPRSRPAAMLPAPPFVPGSTQEAAALIAACAAGGRRLRICGGTVGNDSDDAAALSTGALRGIQAYALDDLFVTAGAGTPLAEVQALLARDGMQVPLASPWPGATLGGIVAANRNAPLRMRYGSIRDLMLAATVVMGDGRVIRAGRPVVKNVAGYDLPKAFAGAHGTLGLIADVTLKLTPLPRARRTLLVPVEDLDRGIAWAGLALSVALVASAVVLWAGGALPEALPGEANGRYLLAYTAEGLAEDVAAELDEVRALLETAGAPAPEEVAGPSGSDLWASLLGESSGERMLVRVGVPPKDLGRLVRDQHDVLAGATFLADVAAGLIYATVRPEGLADGAAWLAALRGEALAAEGYAVVMEAPEAWQDALDRWGPAPAALDVMRRLKARWDPAGILNPGAFMV